MELIPLMSLMALTLAGGFVGACLWALSDGQFDDIETPAMRILKEDLETRKENAK